MNFELGRGRAELRAVGGIVGWAEYGAGRSMDELGQDVPAIRRGVPQDAGHSRRDASAPLLKKWRNMRSDLWDKGPCLRRSVFFVVHLQLSPAASSSNKLKYCKKVQIG